jgi:hypothetical protein
MEQRELVEDFLFPMESEILAAKDDFERHLFLWCIDNYVPLKQFGPHDVHLTFYENLLARPEAELQRLFAFLGDDFDDRVYRIIRRPSPLSRKNTPSPSTEGWRTCVSAHRLQRTMEILRLFGLDHLYGEGTMPDPSFAQMGGV